MYRAVYAERKRGEICIPETSAGTIAADFLIHRKTRAEDADTDLFRDTEGTFRSNAKTTNFHCDVHLYYIIP